MSKTIHAASAFSVNLVREKVGLVTVKVPEGVSIQDDDVAEHWFTKAHLASGGLGSPAYAETVRAQADSTFVKAREAFKVYESLEAAAQEAEAAAGVEEVEPAWKRLAAPPADDSADDDADDDGKADETALEDLTRSELNAMAAEKGIDVSKAKNKAEVIEAITAAAQEAEAADAEKSADGEKDEKTEDAE